MGHDHAPLKHAQVVAEIQRRIKYGQYPSGTLLPSERQLVTEFEVSRPTIVKGPVLAAAERVDRHSAGQGQFGA